MRREQVFCLSLRRIAGTSTAMLIALVLAGAARADTIQVFDVSGVAQNLSGMDLGLLESGSLVGEFTVKGPVGNSVPARPGGGIPPRPEPPLGPEPSSLVFLGTGLIGFGALARRKLRRRATASTQTAIRKPVPFLVGAKWPSRRFESSRLLTTIVSIELTALHSVAQHRRNASGKVVERSSRPN